MAAQPLEPIYERLYRILTSIRSPEKWEYFSLELDRTQQRTTRLLSEFYTGKLINKDTGEVTHIIIKVVPSYGIIKDYEEVYKNEICFYNRIFPALNKFQKSKGIKNLFDNVPNYIGGHSHAQKEFIVMENITAAGFEMLDRNLRYIESKYLKAIFKVYARLHALSFVYKHQHPEEFESLTSDLVDILKLLNTQGLGKPIESAYLAAIDAFNPELEGDIVMKLKKIKNIQETLGNVRSYSGKYKCLTHGNCLLGNILFKYKNCSEKEELQVKLIDFQLAYVSTPVHDLSYFFYSGASKEDMDQVDWYLHLYYDTFSSFVKELGADPQEIYPYEALKVEWKKYSLMGLIMGIGVSVKKLLSKSGTEIHTMVHLPMEVKAEMYRQKMSQIHKENDFKQRAREICLHAVEYGIL
ncbi:uncharacterized protein [Euwallacea similis]|uniref:uncharacterized protein n=1 Tax=Euwallacea similis TaxID=1736056 RepID=UPI00344CA284